MRELVETLWTPVGCDVCGAQDDALTILDTRAGRITQKQNDYAWRHEDAQCTRCGFVFNRLRPTSEFLHDYYTDCWPIASTSITIAPDFNVSTRLALLARRLPPKARVYEIGDKLGEFHAALLAAGYDVAGDDVMAAEAERREWLGGLFRRDRTVMPPAAMRGAFDAVLAYFVVEHLANAEQWLRSIRELLAASGVLVIEVPHLTLHPKEALMHEHFLYLTPEALTALVQEAGYEVVETSATGASRAFGFVLVARRTEAPSEPDLAPLQAAADEMRTSYFRGRDLLTDATANLTRSAELIAQAIKTADAPVRISFFGANQTASEIAGLLNSLRVVSLPDLAVFDNSDAKTGTTLDGFKSPIAKPAPSHFDSNDFHIGVICSRGWTEAVATQIRAFNLPRLVLIDGAAGKVMPTD